MRRCFAGIAAMGCLLISSPMFAGNGLLQKKAEATVDRWCKEVYCPNVAAQSLEVKDGRPYVKEMDVCGGDVVLLDFDRDGDLDAVVELTASMPRGNGATCDLAVFRNDKGSFKFLSMVNIGGRGSCVFDPDNTDIILVGPSKVIDVPLLCPKSEKDFDPHPTEHTYKPFIVSKSGKLREANNKELEDAVYGHDTGSMPGEK